MFSPLRNRFGIPGVIPVIALLKRLGVPATLFAAILAGMALLAIPAGATKAHLFQEEFGSVAQPSFSEAQGVAIDQSSGDVLVMDAGGTPSIKRYKPDGTADDFAALGTNMIDGQGAGDETPQDGLGFSSASESQIAIDNSGTATDGDIYVTQSSPNLINIFSEDGKYLGQLSESSGGAFSEACGVAVDPSGAVYVGDYSSGIHKFVPTANPPVNADNTANFTTVTGLCTLAAGTGPTAGFLFAAQWNGPISKLDSSSGELKYEVSPDSIRTLTVDPGTGHVLAAAGSSVKELDASGAGSATSVTSFLSSSEVNGIAANGSSGDVYISRSGASTVQVFGPVVVIPEVITGAASNVEETGATFNGTVNPEGVVLEKCEFEYGTTTGYGQTVPCAESLGSIGAGTSPVAIHADISGLTTGEEYHFRLVVKNENGTVQGADQAFPTLSAPVVGDAWAQSVVYTEAILQAEVNPKRFATTYQIEYGTSASYGSSTAESNVGSDAIAHTVTKTLESLTPGATYHYRFVATSPAGTTEGPDRTFTTYAPFGSGTNCANEGLRKGIDANLPDCRAYEMVSPVDKNGGDIQTKPNVPAYWSALDQSSTTGNKFTYSSYRAFGGALSAPHTSQYMATREADGWTTQPVSPPEGAALHGPINNTLDTEYKVFTPDLSAAYLAYHSVPLTDDAPSGWLNFYKSAPVGSNYRPLITDSDVAFSEGPGPFLYPALQAVSKDLTHAVFGGPAALTANANPGFNNQVYEWSDGELRLVSVLPDGAATSTESSAGSGIEESETRTSSVQNAVSDDGSRVFWTDDENYFGGSGTIYVRIDGETTRPVSSLAGSGPAIFRAASADGSMAVFTIGQNLYKVDLDVDHSSLVATGLYGVVGVSDNASRIYFVSAEVLDSGATAGAPNLYVDNEGVKTFIATLSNVDMSASYVSDIATRPINRTTRVTPDGNHLAFMSTRSLTGYDNTDAANGKADSEVYVYDVGSDRLTCASCNPSGARPTGGRQYQNGASFNTGEPQVAAWIPTWQMQFYAQRALSDDGNRLFFNSHDALVPRDTNGRQDVYQWEAQGSGSCGSATGCISLISTGESPQGSEFVDASPSGNDVFIRTSSSISAQDPGLVDIYDARANGGFPSPPAPPTPCIGDACQSIPPPPSDVTPGSASFRGAADPSPRNVRPRCRARQRPGGKKAKRHARRHAPKRCARGNGRDVR